MPRRTSPTALLVVVGLAFFTDSILYYLLVPLLPHSARTLALSQMEVGVLFGAYAAAVLAGTWAVGLLADRIGRRTPFLWGLIGLGATTVLFALASSYPLLLLARVLHGLAAAATWTTGLALLAEGFPSARHGEAMGSRSFGIVFSLVNIVYAVGMMAGPLLGSALVEAVGIRGALVATGGVFALYLVPLGRVKGPARPAQAPATLPPP